VCNVFVERSTLLQLGVAYAVLDRLELGARFPIFQQSGVAGPDNTEPPRGTAYGDLTLHGKARLLRLRLGAGNLAAGVGAAIVLPTAKKDQFVGTGHVAVRLLALGALTPPVFDQRLTLTVNLGGVVRGRSQYQTISEGSAMAWG